MAIAKTKIIAETLFRLHGDNLHRAAMWAGVHVKTFNKWLDGTHLAQDRHEENLRKAIGKTLRYIQSANYLNLEEALTRNEVPWVFKDSNRKSKAERAVHWLDQYLTSKDNTVKVSWLKDNDEGFSMLVLRHAAKHLKLYYTKIGDHPQYWAWSRHPIYYKEGKTNSKSFFTGRRHS